MVRSTEVLPGQLQLPMMGLTVGRSRRGLKQMSAAAVRRQARSPSARSKDYAALNAPVGRLRLDSLDDPDWATQLTALLRVFGRTGSANPQRKISEETLRNRTDIMFSTMRLLLPYRIETLAQLKPRLLPRLFELWTEAGVSKRAQINYYNVMRWYWRLFGIEIPAIATYAKTPGEYTIGRSAERDKSWTGNGVSFEEVIKQIEEIDPIAARLFMSMKIFGLRVKESLRLEPHEADGGTALNITKGSKTGRPRAIKYALFGEEQLRQTIEELKDQVPPKCHQAWQNRTLSQAKSRIYTICRRLGITNKELGVTPHGLRHEWAIDQLQRLGNVTAPVRGGPPLNYRALADVRRLIAGGLGHGRPKVTNSYYGSFLSQGRREQERIATSWEKLRFVLQDVGELLAKHDVANLFWIGDRALGRQTGRDAPFVLAFDDEVPPLTSAALAGTIADLVMGGTNQDCEVTRLDALSARSRLMWAEEAVPLFRASAPKSTAVVTVA